MPTAADQSLVQCKALNSCKTLYFRRGDIYEDRHRRNLRNRTYNLFMRNKFKRMMRKVLKYAREIEFMDRDPGSVEKVMDEMKPMLDEACLLIDETCVQGVLHRHLAARRKDRMCRGILRACVAKGYIEKPEDPFKPAYEVIGYELPICYKIREPRPWQLPGWKSPWMLKREFDKWRQQRPEDE